MKSLLVILAVSLSGCATVGQGISLADEVAALQGLDNQVLTDPTIDCTEARDLAQREARKICVLDESDGAYCTDARSSSDSIRQECSRRFEEEHLVRPGY